jgi:hypothetical protein
MIEDNARNQTANQKKALGVGIISGCEESNFNAFKAATN